MVSKPGPYGKLLYIIKSSYQLELYTWSSLDQGLCVLSLGKYFPEDFKSMMPVSS